MYFLLALKTKVIGWSRKFRQWWTLFLVISVLYRGRYEQLRPKGSNCFSRGSIPVFLSKPKATCDFPGGGSGHCDCPLWIRQCKIWEYIHKDIQRFSKLNKVPMRIKFKNRLLCFFFHLSRVMKQTIIMTSLLVQLLKKKIRLLFIRLVASLIHNVFYCAMIALLPTSPTHKF